MDLKKEILKEHSARQKNRIVNYIGADPKRFKELVNIFLMGPYRVTQRASWPLGVCAEKNPDLIRPYIGILLSHLEKPGIHDAGKRNVMRLLQFTNIPAKHEGKVIAICFRLLESRKEPVAVRVFAMTVLANLCQRYPDLKSELRALIENEMPVGSAAFVSRGRKVLKMLAEL